MMGEICGRSERRIKHYSSDHDILLVGEGDFSFSLCLAKAFGSAANIVATSKDAYEELMCKYQNALVNVWTLTSMRAVVLHGVDATQMKALPYLQGKKFHRIIYNFPHAGFHGKEDNPNLIKMHMDLVGGFLQNASSMLWVDGEVHINHKTTAPFDSWKIEDLGLECSLLCIEQDKFKIKDYPGCCILCPTRAMRAHLTGPRQSTDLNRPGQNRETTQRDDPKMDDLPEMAERTAGRAST